jgi:hypothetical protein
VRRRRRSSQTTAGRRGVRDRLDAYLAVVDGQRVGAAGGEVAGVDGETCRPATGRLGECQDDDGRHAAVVAQGRGRFGDGQAQALNVRDTTQPVAAEGRGPASLGGGPAVPVVLQPARQLVVGAAAGQRGEFAVGSAHRDQAGVASDEDVGPLSGGRQHQADGDRQHPQEPPARAPQGAPQAAHHDEREGEGGNRWHAAHGAGQAGHRVGAPHHGVDAETHQP